MSKKNAENLELEQEEANSLRELEKFYTTGQIENLQNNINKYKEKLVGEMIEYAKEHEKCVKWSKDGDELDFSVEINPIVINNRFFKPIISIGCQEPEYNAEKLSLVYDFYCDILAEVNDKIGNFPSSLTSFCKFAGITSYTLKTYRNSSDLNMRIIAEKIYDQIGDENITMSQMGIARERTTIFKLKAQNELVEKEQPKISINITEKPDMDRINERLNKYKVFANKKGK